MPLAGRFVVQSVSALLVVGLIALIAIVGMTIWLNERSQSHFEEVIAARDLRSAAVELRNAVQSAESSERGYALTGNEIYLSPYGTMKISALRQLDALQRKSQITSIPPVLSRLSEAVKQKFADMDRVITLKQARLDAEALAIIRTNRGKQAMDEINLFVSGIVRATDDSLTRGVTEQRANATRLRLASILAAILIMLVVAGVLVTVYRYTLEITAARDEVSALNASLEARVAGRTAQLATANGEIQRFAHIMSHDLRAPLINIIGFASELEAGLSTLQSFVRTLPRTGEAEQAKAAAEVDMPEALSFIRSSTRRMDSLINAILKISREGQRRLHAEVIKLDEMAEAILSAIRHQLEEGDGSCQLNLEVRSIVTDKLSLEQVLSNLLDNAVKYRAKDRPLRIEIRSQIVTPDQIRIEVSDNGRGIAQSDIPRIFELFGRAGVRDQAGEGIGLAYVQTLVRNLGGEISVASNPNHGTRFSIVLPADLRAIETGYAA
jgi:signal transduction histidine kinase